MEKINLGGLSADALGKIAAEAAALAEDLRAKEPNYALALANGVRNTSYNTVSNGYVYSYDGEAVITMADGSRWRAVGHAPRRNSVSVSRQGFIEFIPLSGEE